MARIKVIPNCRHYTIYGIDNNGDRETIARALPENQAFKMRDALQVRVDAGNLQNYFRNATVVKLDMVAGDWY